MEVSDAQDLYERISVRCQFQKLINLHNFPNSFTDNHFYYSPASTLFDINSLLKPMKEVHMKVSAHFWAPVIVGYQLLVLLFDLTL